MLQPIIYDDDASMRVSLLGLDPSIKQGPKMLSWRNNGSFLNVWPNPLHPPEAPCQLTTPHSSAFVDINGDCQPDIVLHCERARANERALQIYLGQGKEGYFLSKTIDLPSYSRAITFADMSTFFMCANRN